MDFEYPKGQLYLGLFLAGFIILPVVLIFVLSPLSCWPMVVLIAFICWFFFRDGFPKGPQVRIDERGIEDFRTKLGLIPWSDIIYVCFKSMQVKAIYVQFCYIVVNNPEKYLSKASKLQRFVLLVSRWYGGDPCVVVKFTWLIPDMKEAVKYTELNHPDKIRQYDP